MPACSHTKGSEFNRHDMTLSTLIDLWQVDVSSEHSSSLNAADPPLGVS
jgi:hypothetical protein